MQNKQGLDKSQHKPAQAGQRNGASCNLVTSRLAQKNINVLWDDNDDDDDDDDDADDPMQIQ